MSLPRLKYLRKANDCNYCHAVRGFVHAEFGERERRLLRVVCLCGKKHLVCFGCARKIGSVWRAGVRCIASCAKRWYWRNVRKKAVANGGKGA